MTKCVRNRMSMLRISITEGKLINMKAENTLFDKLFTIYIYPGSTRWHHFSIPLLFFSFAQKSSLQLSNDFLAIEHYILIQVCGLGTVLHQQEIVTVL